MTANWIRFSIALFLATVGSGRPTAYQEPIQSRLGCRQNPAVVGDCFIIHGRLSATNGTPSMRIWRIGTKRVLGVSPSEDEIVPETVKKYFGSGTHIYGDFLVCPFTPPRPTEMQMVCVESATNL